MALWLIRIGRHGEYEQRFLGSNRLYATWSGLKQGLNKAKSKADVQQVLRHWVVGGHEL